MASKNGNGNGNGSGRRRANPFRSTEPAARKVLQQIEKTRQQGRKVNPKKKTAKRKTKAKRRYA